MRAITAVFAVMFLLSLAACEKTDYEKQAQKDGDARRALNTGIKN